MYTPVCICDYNFLKQGSQFNFDFPYIETIIKFPTKDLMYAA